MNKEGDPFKIGSKLDSLVTPAFIVDLDVVERNCEKMRSVCSAQKIVLRPQMKTHKTLYVCKIVPLMTLGAFESEIYQSKICFSHVLVKAHGS